MARATKGTRVLKRVTKKTVPTVNLELTEGEADFLQAVLSRVGGDKENSPRKYQLAISKALEFATEQKHNETDAYTLLGTGYLAFKNYPKPRGNVSAALEYMKRYRDRDTRENPRIGVYGDIHGIPDGREARPAPYDVYDHMGYR